MRVFYNLQCDLNLTFSQLKVNHVVHGRLEELSNLLIKVWIFQAHLGQEETMLYFANWHNFK